MTQPRPSGEKIAAIAEKLDLKKNVVRVSTKKTLMVMLKTFIIFTKHLDIAKHEIIFWLVNDTGDVENIA